MAVYRVTASITLEYDTADGLVSDIEEAQDDLLDALARGTFSYDDFTIDVFEVH